MPRQIVYSCPAPHRPTRPPARQGAKLPARVAGLKVSIAAIAEA